MDRKALIESLAVKYEKSPVLRTLVNFLPYGGGFDVFASAKSDEFRKQRTHAFFEELASGKIESSPELLEQEDFLFCFESCCQAAIGTRDREKIRCFARLLNSCVSPQKVESIEEFEDLFEVLRALTPREMALVARLREFRSVPRSEDFDASALDGNEDEVAAALARLSRTGCIAPLAEKGAMFGGGTGPGRWRITPFLHRLCECIEIKAKSL